jgi:hypothetical protein
VFFEELEPSNTVRGIRRVGRLWSTTLLVLTYAYRIHQNFKIEETDDQKRMWAHDPIEVCWYTANALDKLGPVVGLTVFGRFGDFHGGPYQPGVLNMIWDYRKE